MKILVLNAGSSSQKSCLYHVEGSLPAEPPPPLWEAQIDWLPQRADQSTDQKAGQGTDAATETHAARLRVASHTGRSHQKPVALASRGQVLFELLSMLHQGDTAVLSNLREIDMVGHRVVHGGQAYTDSVLITPEVKQAIDRLSALAPSHNPANLEGILLMERLLGDVPQVAVFDTAFHSKMPEVAAIYSGPYEWAQQGIRRYGFHGISHQYCTHRAAHLLNRPVEDLRLIICHLGNGASLSAVKHGRSVDTTMGFTPLEGLMMGTRSGSVDPGVLLHLMRQGQSVDELDATLNKASGLKGISGVSHDLREISAAISQGNQRAQLAQDIYLHRLKACLGEMLMSLDGNVNAIVFTAGVGENSPTLRAAACEAMSFLGVAIAPEKNEHSPVDEDIATAEAKVRVLVIHTQEDWAIAQDCWRFATSSLH